MDSEIYTDDYPLKDKTYAIIGACMEVHNELGPGFLEPIYQEALAIEFQKRSIEFEREKVLKVMYKEVTLNKKYISDFVCFNKIIIELKAIKQINNNHLSQVLNYLKATKLKLGLIINFGNQSLQYKRVIL